MKRPIYLRGYDSIKRYSYFVLGVLFGFILAFTYDENPLAGNFVSLFIPYIIFMAIFDIFFKDIRSAPLPLIPHENKR